MKYNARSCDEDDEKVKALIRFLHDDGAIEQFSKNLHTKPATNTPPITRTINFDKESKYRIKLRRLLRELEVLRYKLRTVSNCSCGHSKGYHKIIKVCMSCNHPISAHMRYSDGRVFCKETHCNCSNHIINKIVKETVECTYNHVKDCYCHRFVRTTNLVEKRKNLLKLISKKNAELQKVRGEHK